MIWVSLIDKKNVDCYVFYTDFYIMSQSTSRNVASSMATSPCPPQSPQALQSQSSLPSPNPSSSRKALIELEGPWTCGRKK